MLFLSKNLQYHDLLMKTAQKKLLGRIEKANNNKQAQQKQVSQQEGDEDFFEDGLDGDFWNKVYVRQSQGLSWKIAMDEERVERLIQRCKGSGELIDEDPALVMLKKWPVSKQYRENPERLPGLEQSLLIMIFCTINRLLEILLRSKFNLGDRYKMFRDEDDKARKTLLHYAAELGFLHVTKTLVKIYPGQLILMTKSQLKPLKKRAMLPVELALEAEKDDVAAYLIRVMRHESVQSLFSWRPGNLTNPQPSCFSFKSIIENAKMQKTVVAVLDQMVNPHWPHLPKRKDSYENEEEREAVEGAWNTIPYDPLNYHFYYHILEGDDGGRPPKILASDEPMWIENKYFNWREKSCLHVIAKSNNKEALQHPAVRMLIKTKWKNYGFWFLSLQAALYVIFLMFLTYSLLHASTKTDPTQYSGVADALRGFCEVVTLLMAAFYVCEELIQIRIERLSYFTEWMNLFDWFGLVLILCIIPLRYTDNKVQWLVASLSFLFNFLRIFKFSCITRTTGLYTQTLAKIILHDVTRSMAVFIVIFLSFCGALSLSFCYSDQDQQFRGFGDVMLSGFRALSEQLPIEGDYTNLNWLSILLMMSYMGTVTVILLNILIAQMSTTYTQAKKVARLEYDVDRILQLTRMERFPLLNLRVRYYKDGDWISEMKLAQELLEFSEDRSPWDSVEEKLNAIRDMMRKMVKQMRPRSG